MHATYFLSYAMLITVSGVVMAVAYYLRLKHEGAPVNYKLLGILAVVGHGMWTGAALTMYAYEPGPMTAGFVVAVFSIWFAAGLAWQIRVYVKDSQTARLV